MSSFSSDADALIEQSAQRLFAAEVDRACRDRVEAGAFDERLWRLAVDNGFSLALAIIGGSYRQFVDKITPTMMRPNPHTRFHAPRVDSTGIFDSVT